MLFFFTFKYFVDVNYTLIALDVDKHKILKWFKSGKGVAKEHFFAPVAWI